MFLDGDIDAAVIGKDAGEFPRHQSGGAMGEITAILGDEGMRAKEAEFLQSVRPESDAIA
jgi:hypothetical protein